MQIIRIIKYNIINLIMREIVSVHVGKCAIQIGEKYWESLVSEHEIKKTGKYIGED